jgi:choline-sulfatase
MPTVAEIAGIRSEEFVTDIDGAGLLGLASRPDTKSTRSVFCEHLDGATNAPRVMVRHEQFKYVMSQAYPPQLYDLQRDPSELINLSGQSQFAEIERQLVECVDHTWDLEKLKSDVAAAHKIRRFLFESLSKGRFESWDYAPASELQNRFVRRGDMFPQVEQRGYLHYRDRAT